MSVDQPSTVPERDSLLRREMSRELRRWRTATVSYGVTYYLSRIALITFSTIVAAKENLGAGHGAWLISWVPAFALAVAVLTAFDTWLKPQQKWRGFMESRDKLASLMVTANLGANPDNVRAKFDTLRAAHRDKNIF